MKKTHIIAATLVPLLVSVAFAASGWSTYEAKEYGFRMLVPHGTSWADKELGAGWGVLYSKHDGVELYAVGRLGAPAKQEEIERFGVKATGVAGEHWTHLRTPRGHPSRYQSVRTS